MKRLGFKNPLVTAAVIALGISTALSAYLLFSNLSARIDWLTDSSNRAPVVGYVVFAADILAIIGTVAAVLLVARELQPRIVFAIFGFAFLAGLPLSIVSALVFGLIAGYPLDLGEIIGWYVNLNWADPTIAFTDKFFDFSNFFSFIALVLYVIGSFLRFGPRPATAAPAATPAAATAGQTVIGYDTNTGAPIYGDPQ